MFGFLVIDKSRGLSSRTALNPLTKLFRPAKVGHAGTLDPLATGVLVACIGLATRLVGYVQQLPKKYSATFRLGFESETEDIESELVPVAGATTVNQHMLESLLPQFIGTIIQQPPQFSALRVQGKRAYHLARQGKTFELQPRTIEIFSLKLSRFAEPEFELEIECGSGTYVRSLGRDIGRALGSGAVMTALVRTAIGKFTIQQAQDVSAGFFQPGSTELEDVLIPPTLGLCDMPKVTLSRTQVTGLSNAIPITIEHAIGATEVAGLDERGRLIAILRRLPDGTHSPAINFAGYWQQRSVSNVV